MKLDNLSWETLRTYLLNDRKFSDKPSAIYAVRSRFRTLLKWFGDKEFNRTNFNLFIQYLRELKYSMSYTNNFIKLTKTLGLYLRTDEFRDYTYFKENKTFTGEVLTPGEIEQIVNCGTNPKYKALILLLGTTGCRIGEALSLVQEDVNATPPHVIFRDTKNNSDRQVPISVELYTLIKSLGNTGSVFGINQSQWVNLELKRRARTCGIQKRVYCHLFRHSYITTMLEAGAGVLDVGYIVGHRDPKVTARYRHSSLDYYAEVAKIHPLLSGERTLKQVAERLRKASEILTAGKFHLDINENEREFTLRVRV